MVVSQQAREGTEVMELRGAQEQVRLTVSRVDEGGPSPSDESLVTVIRERRREEGRP